MLMLAPRSEGCENTDMEQTKPFQPYYEDTIDPEQRQEIYQDGDHHPAPKTVGELVVKNADPEHEPDEVSY